MKKLAGLLCVTFMLTSIFADDYSRQISKALPKVQKISDAYFTAHEYPLEESEWNFIPADDPGFYYTSRVDFSDPANPVLIWEGTEVQFSFSGTKLGLRFKNSNSETSYYNVTVDDQIYLLHMEPRIECDYVLEKKLKDGNHTCKIFKRNEAGMIDTFCGVDVEIKRGRKSTGKLGAKPEPLPKKIEFYGDSITAGVCTETEGNDSYETDQMITHNAYTSYPAIVCRDLGYELSDIAVGGTGITCSWNDYIISKSWKKLYAKSYGADYDFSTGRTPDIVVLNLGQNDFGYPASKGEKISPDFMDRYFEMLSEIRNQYPDAWIICATGGMSAIKDCKELGKGITDAVKKMDDPKILEMTYKAFTYNHPRVDTHILMAKQLEKFIQEKIAW